MADDFSRFKKTEQITRLNVKTYGRWARPDFVDQSKLEKKDIFSLSINQTFAGRPDLIALEFYGVPQLEWVVTMFNNPLNPLGFPVAGSVIKLPSKEAVMREL